MVIIQSNSHFYTNNKNNKRYTWQSPKMVKAKALL